VLNHVVAENDIEGALTKRQPVAIADHIRARNKRDVELIIRASRRTPLRFNIRQAADFSPRRSATVGLKILLNAPKTHVVGKTRQ
jgi:hypothetical protein